jgi:hypothetical protein
MNGPSIDLIDVEASGLHFDSYPIEIAVLVKGRIYSWLIKPHTDWKYWCPTAEKMHGISRETLEKQGVDAAGVARDILRCLEGSRGLLFSDAAPWDIDWVTTLFAAANVPRLFHIASLEEILTPDQQTVFNEAKKRLSESGKYRLHRAKDDVRLIHEAFIEATRSG